MENSNQEVWKTCLSLTKSYKDKIRFAQIMFDLESSQLNDTIAFLIDKALEPYTEELERLQSIKEMKRE